MKLVDTLARELKEWPINATHAVVTRGDAETGVPGVSFTKCGAPVWIHTENDWSIRGYGCGRDVFWLTEYDIPNPLGCEPSEENIVSQSEWQSARAAYLASIQPTRDPESAAVVDKPANPWRRNRGRKTPPVPVGTRVDVKYRDGDENYGVRAGFASDFEGSHEWRVAFSWILAGESGDIMQWRYAEPQQAEEKPMAQTIEQVIDNAESAAAEAFNPIALRDEYKRITLECEELSQQMGKLTDRMGDIEAALRAEGFALVEPEKHNAD